MSEEKETKEEGLFNKQFFIKIIRIIVSLALMLLAQFYLNETNFNLAINLSVMLIAYVILAYDIFIEAIEDIVKEHEILSEEMLMIIATIGAFSLRAFGKEHNEFLEANMVVLLFQIGEMFEDFADYSSSKAIVNAVGLRSKVAHLIKDDKIKDIDPKELKIDDIITIKTGEIIPADGNILEGEAFIDMSSLTGESVPVKRKINDSVFAGTILKEGVIKVKVTKEYKDNTVSKIVNLIEEGKESKSKATRFVDKFAKIYTPTVVLIAFCVAIIPPLVINFKDGLIWQEWIYKSLSLLVISCPCAIVISVPLAYFSGIGLASKNGIIIKGGAIIDKLNEVGTLITDKTGTLTYGSFSIVKENTISSNKDDFYKYLLIGESLSNHPISKAIIKDKDVSIYQKDITDYKEIAGFGIKAIYKEHEILVGNDKLLDKFDIKHDTCSEVGTIIKLAVDKTYLGYVVLADTIREDSYHFISSLHQMNIKTMMLTGDKKEIALDTASKLKIDDCKYELLPEDKTECIKESISNEKDKKVAYIGDGINDASAISLADVGIAMGKDGADLAIDSADVVLMNDKPSKFTTSLKISRLVRNYVLFDIIFSIIVKLTIMILSTCLKNFPLYAAVIADTGLTVILVVITITILYHKFKRSKQLL